MTRIAPDLTAIRAALLTGFAVACIYTAIGQWFLVTGTLDHFNRLFDTDPSQRLGDIASGWSSGASIHWTVPHSVHPLLPYLFSPFFRASSWLVLQVGLELEPLQVRQIIGVCVVPVMSGLAAGLFSLVASGLGLRGSRLLLSNLLIGLSFSNVIFGSIPDDKALTKVGAVLLLFLAWRSMFQERSSKQWTISSLFTVGITITNVYMVVVTKFFSELGRGRGLRAATQKAGNLALATTVVALAIGVLAGIYFYGPPERSGVENYAKEWIAIPALTRLLSLLSAVGEAWIPTQLIDHRVPDSNWSIIMLGSGIAPTWQSCLAGIWTIAVSIWGLVRLWNASHAARWLGIVGLAQFGYILLFTFWGDSPFLYSQHWIAANQVFLLGLLVKFQTFQDRFAIAACTVHFVVGAIASSYAWAFIFTVAPSPAT